LSPYKDRRLEIESALELEQAMVSIGSKGSKLLNTLCRGFVSALEHKDRRGPLSSRWETRRRKRMQRKCTVVEGEESVRIDDWRIGPKDEKKKVREKCSN